MAPQKHPPWQRRCRQTPPSSTILGTSPRHRELSAKKQGDLEHRTRSTAALEIQCENHEGQPEKALPKRKIVLPSGSSKCDQDAVIGGLAFFRALYAVQDKPGPSTLAVSIAENGQDRVVSIVVDDAPRQRTIPLTTYQAKSGERTAYTVFHANRVATCILNETRFVDDQPRFSKDFVVRERTCGPQDPTSKRRLERRMKNSLVQVEADHEPCVLEKSLAHCRRCIETANEVVDYDDDFADVRFLRGVCHRVTGDSAAALLDLNRAIEKSRNNPMAFVERGQLFFAAGDTKNGCADMAEAIRLDPNFGNASVEERCGPPASSE